MCRSIFSRDEGLYSEWDMSTFGQTLFNACNLLMGVGLLSLPYAMRLAGWFGVAVLLSFSALTCYTAKILGKIQEYVPAKKLREGPGAYTIYGFHDMGGLVFGEAGRLFISVVFIAETFGYCCVYLIIEGENLQHQLGDLTQFISWGKPEFMCLAALIFLPTCMLRNLSWLSYASALGVFSSVCLLVCVCLCVCCVCVCVLCVCVCVCVCVLWLCVCARVDMTCTMYKKNRVET